MLNAQVEEAFTGHAIVKAFGRQHEVEERFRTTNDELYDASFGAQFVSGAIQPAMMFIGNLNFVAIAVIGGLRVSSGAMTIGDIQAFIQYSRQFTQPITQVASMANVLQSGIASLERVFELLDAIEQTPDALPPAYVSQPRGRVEFEHVNFSYDKDRELIRDLSLVAEPGSTVAIVGPTGAGKTTLVNLIMRFYELDGGRITLDGVDISQMRRRDLRGDIGMVLQDTWLFGGTIRDNIAYGNPDATEEQVIAAAKAAYVDRFVHMLPQGYDSVVDDEGGSISAGEKQLITIARAFLADPAILILDEATSSVDTRTEVLIQKAMSALRSSRTSFVIAHRLSTIRDADTILVMDAGQIVEQGNHAELLAVGARTPTSTTRSSLAPQSTSTSSRRDGESETRSRRRLQRLAQLHEPEVRAQRTRVLVERERLALAGDDVAAPLVPREQLLANVDHHSGHRLDVPQIAHRLLGSVQQRSSEPPVLQPRVHREHAEVALVAVLLDQHAAHEDAVGLRQQEARVGLFVQLGDLFDARALAGEQVRLARPALRGLGTAVRELDERPDGRDVVSSRVAVGRLGHERRLSLFTAVRTGPGANELARWSGIVKLGRSPWRS